MSLPPGTRLGEYEIARPLGAPTSGPSTLPRRFNARSRGSRSGRGLQTDPTFSPDGRFVAYASDRAGNFDIWVQPVGGGDPVQVTRSPAHDTQPDWSPDGASLVFRSEREGGGLFVVPSLGGVERQVSSFGSNPSWAKTSEIQFLSGTAPGEAGWPTRLFVVTPGEGDPQEILGDFLKGGAWFWLSGTQTDGFRRGDATS